MFAAPPLAAPVGNQPQQQVTPEAVAKMIQEALTQRGIPPMPLLQKPYPDWVDRDYELPRGYRIPEFTKFTGDDDQRPTDHLARFELQCGDAGQNEFLKLRLFPYSLADSALEWYYTIHNPILSKIGAK